VSIYWKNGVATNLSGYGMAEGIAAQNNDVYVAGNMITTGVYTYPGYWKTGYNMFFQKMERLWV